MCLGKVTNVVTKLPTLDCKYVCGDFVTSTFLALLDSLVFIVEIDQQVEQHFVISNPSVTTYKSVNGYS